MKQDAFILHRAPEWFRFCVKKEEGSWEEGINDRGIPWIGEQTKAFRLILSPGTALDSLTLFPSHLITISLHLQ